MGRFTISKMRGQMSTYFNPKTVLDAREPTIHAESTVLGSFFINSVAAHVFSPHGAHLQLLAHCERVFGMSGLSLSVGACHLCLSSDLTYALSRITTAREGPTGWTIHNRTDRRLLVRQCFSGIQNDEPAAKALSDVIRVCIEAGGSFPSWRPIVLPTSSRTTHVITLRIALLSDSVSLFGSQQSISSVRFKT